MSAFAFFLLMMLLAKQSGTGGGGAVTSALPVAAAKAQKEALAKTYQAQKTGNPVHQAEAKAAQTKAAVLTQAVRTAATAKTAATAAKTAPPPWPQAAPNGLPPFPSGWVPDQPPPKAVQTRAWQLLPMLWKQGANARKTEQTAGRWITYVAQAMGPKKGVVAYKVRPGALPTASPPPTGPQANA